MICKDRKTANRLKREIRKGKTFAEIVAENYPDAVENQTWDSGIVRLEAVIPALQRVIPKLKPGSLYGPVVSDGNAFLIRLVETYEANTVRDLALVRNEIFQRLKENHYREQYQKLLVSLKNKKHIDLNFDLLKKAISDTLVEDGS